MWKEGNFISERKSFVKRMRLDGFIFENVALFLSLTTIVAPEVGGLHRLACLKSSIRCY